MTARPTTNRPATAQAARPAKTGRKPTEEQLAASQAKRNALKDLSRPIQDVRGKDGSAFLALMPEATSTLFAMFQNKDAFPTVNSCLECLYTLETGFTCWKTFAGWKAEGYTVKKGETGRAVWGTPREMKQSEESEEAGKDWYPMSYIFHGGQVEEMIEEFGNAVQTAAQLQAQGKDKAARAQMIEETHGADATAHLQAIGAL